MRIRPFLCFVLSLFIYVSYVEPYDSNNWRWTNAERSVFEDLRSTPKHKRTKEEEKEYKRLKNKRYHCQRTNHYILTIRSMVPVTYKTEKECQVVKGKWKSWFTGKIYTNPRVLNIDHLVPKKYIYDHGGKKWPKFLKLVFVNYQKNLFIVEASLNKSKGSRDPSEWMPPKYKCRYVTNFIMILVQWGIVVTQREFITYERLVHRYCNT